MLIRSHATTVSLSWTFILRRVRRIRRASGKIETPSRARHEPRRVLASLDKSRAHTWHMHRTSSSPKTIVTPLFIGATPLPTSAG